MPATTWPLSTRRRPLYASSSVQACGEFESLLAGRSLGPSCLIYGRNNVAINFLRSGGRLFQLLPLPRVPWRTSFAPAARRAPDFAPPLPEPFGFSLIFEGCSTPLGGIGKGPVLPGLFLRLGLSPAVFCTIQPQSQRLRGDKNDALLGPPDRGFPCARSGNFQSGFTISRW